MVVYAYALALLDEVTDVSAGVKPVERVILALELRLWLARTLRLAKSCGSTLFAFSADSTKPSAAVVATVAVCAVSQAVTFFALAILAVESFFTFSTGAAASVVAAFAVLAVGCAHATGVLAHLIVRALATGNPASVIATFLVRAIRHAVTGAMAVLAPCALGALAAGTRATVCTAFFVRAVGDTDFLA